MTHPDPARTSELARILSELLTLCTREELDRYPFTLHLANLISDLDLATPDAD